MGPQIDIPQIAADVSSMLPLVWRPGKHPLH
jgi:hypothetical protein